MDAGQRFAQRHAAGETWHDIADSEGLSYQEVRQLARAWKVSRQTAEQTTETTADKMRAVYREYLGTSVTVKDEVHEPTGKRHVVALGDLHGAPSPDILKAVIAERPDLIIIGGDLLDQRQASVHSPEYGDKQTTLREEMATVRAFIETLLIKTSAVIWVLRGNHDSWTYKTIHSLLPPWALEFFQDPLDLLLAGLPRVEVIATPWTYYYPDNTADTFGESRYLLPLGDTLISHADFTGRNPGDAVRKLSTWIERWRQPLGLPAFSLLVQFHGHRIAHLEEAGGWQIWIEPGMGGLPNIESYKVQYKGAWGPGALGCVAFDQDNKNGGWCTRRASVKLIRPRR